MNKADIGLIAAMRDEIAPLLRRVDRYERERAGTLPAYRFRIGPFSACVIESGMGPSRAADAAAQLIGHCRPSAILNFGFAGALSPTFKVGDLVVADRLLFYREGLFSEQPGDPPPQAPPWSELPKAAFVTTYRITDKKLLAQRLPAGIRQAVVEMETAAAATAARAAGIPFAAIRAVSDAFDEELGFTLDEFCDSNLNLRLRRVLLTVVRKPRIVPQLLRLSGNAKIAGSNLATFLHSNLQTIIPT